ncbi:hypothetical protein QN372_00560 [Undibacterium sp. RTI2.1]|nr:MULTISPECIES: hypothetical protein [unclassified Undibacterium]MEB0230175.1 hypothetical protein [Undibacterium sp. 10I3]MDY7537630.1 hypothetical protein [Undibacterium sp. 5I1]MEB0029231.1 hypothetical protein [Undibacterium sp. RTI2.1]MEB0115539.1 hypothetical protein [Undibacterium sp. RTI2.2]MEB0256367.1 hypothetical protein [Undibacterium sp. 5I1]
MDILGLISAVRQAEQVAVAMAPTLNNLVAEAAKTFGLDSSTNTQKLQHVQDRLRAYWQFAGEVGVDFDKAWPVLSVVITGIVKAYNFSGGWTTAIAALNVIAAA